MYYKAKELAIKNGRTYHLVAILKRKGHVVKIGENTSETHPKYKRSYLNGDVQAHMHAEMNVLRFSKPGDTLEVIRFSKCNHERTMAKPCEVCMNLIIKAGIKKVRYTNWQGEWEEINLKKERREYERLNFKKKHTCLSK